ncbi:hypothetical protein DV515_00012357 [Chloebia gouldiae]|uniref:Uncharacterized protein n=1 Tax=Chloebia gouldiae TaxID=44316 RepID=A0A3L8S4T3_CHLGU|nr:hypothetical protein DV515_00012357 [Chloebia gouldiae]
MNTFHFDPPFAGVSHLGTLKEERISGAGEKQELKFQCFLHVTRARGDPAQPKQTFVSAWRFIEQPQKSKERRRNTDEVLKNQNFN